MRDRKTGALHVGRVSVSGATYFVTGCVSERRTSLASISVVEGVRAIWTEFDTEGDTSTLAAAVMPDHFHWLFTLGNRLSLGRVLAKLKTQSRRLWRSGGGEWQRDFFEHQLRDAESAEAYGFYIFMNPYRAKLIAADQAWRGWHCPQPDRFRFTGLLDSAGKPPRQWLDLPVDEGLHVGE